MYTYTIYEFLFLTSERCIPLLIQQNLDGSNVFNRSWDEFKLGFSDSRGNYWLGNDLLSELTHSGRYKLRFDLHGLGRGWYYAEYSTFVVMGEHTNYKLHVYGYSGNATPGRIHSVTVTAWCSPRMTATTTRGWTTPVRTIVQYTTAADSGTRPPAAPVMLTTFVAREMTSGGMRWLGAMDWRQRACG